MAQTKILKVSRGPLPDAPEPCLYLQLSLTTEEISRVLKSQQRLTTSLLPWLEVSLSAEARDEVKAGELIVQLARALVNEYGGVIATATCQPSEAGLSLTLGYHQPKVAAQALSCALTIACTGETLTAHQLAQQLEAFWKVAGPFTPDPIARLLITEAQKAGIPVRPYHWPTRQWLYGWGVRSETFFEASPHSDSHAGRNLSSDKQLSKLLATASGFKVLPSQRVANINDLEKAGITVGFPCVVKPIQGKQGKGVTTNIPDQKELREAWNLAQQTRPSDVLVEQFSEGDVYRLMVIRGKFICSMIRRRPSVQGDGQSTIQQLAETRNLPLIAQQRPSHYGGPAPLDGLFHNCLRRQGFKAESVPEVGRKIYLRDIPLVLEGATDVTDVTEQVHPNLMAAAVDLANMLGIDCAGIDVISADIGQETSSYFLEINGTPGIIGMSKLCMTAQEATRLVLGPKPSRIPTLLVVASAAHQAGLAQALQQKPGLGWSCGGKVGIGTRLLSTELTSSYDHLELLVRNPSVHALAVVLEPEILIHLGLPLDRWDLIAVTADVNLTTEFTAWLKMQGRNCEPSVNLNRLTATIEDFKTA